MKRLLFMLLLLLPFISKSQIMRDTSFKQIDAKMRNAGLELNKYYHQYSTGILMEIGGLAITAIGSASNTNGSSNAVVYAGLGLGLIGTIFIITSNSHIDNAGLILRGNSLIVPLHKN